VDRFGALQEDFGNQMEKDVWEGGGGMALKQKQVFRKSSPNIAITGRDINITGSDLVAGSSAGLFVNRHSDHVITDKSYSTSDIKIRKPRSEKSANNKKVTEMWEGGRRVSELSKIFDSSEGGSDKSTLPRSLSRSTSRTTGPSRPTSRASSRATCENQVTRSVQPPSSSFDTPTRSTSAAEMAKSSPRPRSPRARSCPRPGPQRMRSTPLPGSPRVSARLAPRLSAFNPPQGVDLSIDGDGSAFDTSRAGSEASRTSSTPRAVFKLEPYTPRTPINQISKVETVVSLGDQHLWQRKESSLEQLEVEVVRLREENRGLLQQLETARDSSDRYMSLEKELEQLQWQLTRMEDSRKMYEAATNQLVGFLDLVSQQLSGIVPETESRLSGIAPASESRLSIDGLGSLGAFPHLQGFKSGSSLGGESMFSTGSRLSLGLPPTSRRRRGLDDAGKTSLGGAPPSRLSADVMGLNRDLHLLRELDALRDLNLGSDLGASRLSLAPSDLSTRLLDVRREMVGRSNRLADIPRSKSVMAIPGLSENEVSSSSFSQPSNHQRRKQRLIATQTTAPDLTKLRRKTPPSMEPVWRRSDGSEGGASLESKDSGRSTDSCSSGRSSPKQDRQLLAGRARRMVRAVKQFLAREKTKYPAQKLEKSSSTSPWILKEKENIPIADPNHDLHDKDHATNPAGRVVIRIRPENERGILSQSNRGNNSKPTKKQVSTPTKSYSFSHSTPRGADSTSRVAELTPSVVEFTPRVVDSENMIKITNMGTVSVPVPYPVNSNDKQWF